MSSKQDDKDDNEKKEFQKWFVGFFPLDSSQATQRDVLSRLGLRLARVVWAVRHQLKHFKKTKLIFEKAQ